MSKRLCVVLAMASLLAAQEGKAPAPRPRRVLVDAVVATVDDGAIMRSELATVTAGKLRALYEQYGPLPAREVERVQRAELETIINTRRMAAAVKSFGVFTPEQVEAFFEEDIRREEKDQLRSMGSTTELSRELKRQGRTWQTFKSEQRVRKMYELARDFAVSMRMQRQSNLYLTPRMLRDTYDREQRYFVREAEARVALVQFRGPDAEAAAHRAAEQWRKDGGEARKLAAGFPEARVLEEMTATGLAAEFASIRAFALAGPEGAVTAPTTVNGTVYIARVTDLRPARNGRFEDPDVQQELRNMCTRAVQNEFFQQAVERATLRTEVWESPSLGLPRLRR